MTRCTQLMFDVVIPGVYTEFGLDYDRHGAVALKDHREEVKYAPSAALWENQNMCVQSAACIQLKGFSMSPDFQETSAALPSLSSSACSVQTFLRYRL